MRRRWTLLVVAGAVAVAACGSRMTEDARHDAVQSRGPAGAGVNEGNGVPGLPAGGSGVSAVGNEPGTGEGDFGGVSAGASGAGSGPTITAPGRTRQPIQIGVLVTDTGKFLTAFGLPSPADLIRNAMHALVEEINKNGGVAGRQLAIVDASVEFSSASWGTEFEAACQKFTRDNHVAAVLYDGVVYSATFNTCLTKAGVPSLYMGGPGSSVGDITDLATNYPGLIVPGQVSLDRRVQSILNKAIAANFLPAGSKLGIFIEDCPYGRRAFDRTLMPIVKRQRLTLVTYVIDCAEGAADESGIALVQSAALRFKAEGVETVMFHTVFENGVVFFFAASAEQANYRPQYLLFHNQGCPGCKAFFEDKGLRPQLEKMRGFGGVPLWDVTYPPAPPAAQAAARKTCLSRLKRHDVVPADLPQRATVYDACDVVNLLHRGLTLSGGQGGTRHLRPAVESIGTEFISTMTFNGATRLGPGRHDGIELTAVSVWQAKCQCFVYSTKPSPIT